MLNKEINLIVWVVVLLVIGMSTGFTQDKVGTTSAPFLGISIGTRATAMGAAYAAVADDATAMYYNPGAIATIGSSQALLSHADWLVGTNLNWLGFVLNMDGNNAIGVSITYLDYGEEEVTTEAQQEGTGEMWSASDMTFGVTYARAFTDRFSIGGSVKYVEQKIWHESASAFAVDVGLIFTTAFHDMKLGMSICNFGNDMQMDGRDLLHKIDIDDQTIGHNETIVGNLKTDSWPLPLFFRVGLAMNVIKTPFYSVLLAVDALRPTDNSEVLNVGTEWSIYNMFYLRAGYKSLFRDESEEGLTAGLGLKFSQGGAMDWSLNYAWADYGLFQPVQMFSIAVGF